MKLPNFSFMVRVGQMRAIQARFEPAESRNPDNVAGALLSWQQRLACQVQGRLLLGRMRSQPFYSFVLARTRHYDEVFLDGLAKGIRHIVNIGCGSDTRSIRFAAELKRADATVLEIDQADAIDAKQRIVAQRFGPLPHVEYMPIDLNDATLPAFEAWLDGKAGQRLLVILEGVSPYVDQRNFERFLRLIATRCAANSLFAYDFKHDQAPAGFGASERTVQPFRLPKDDAAVATFHAGLGLPQQSFETSRDMSLRLASPMVRDPASGFDEDCLVRLTVGAPASP